MFIFNLKYVKTRNEKHLVNVQTGFFKTRRVERRTTGSLCIIFKEKKRLKYINQDKTRSDVLKNVTEIEPQRKIL